MDGMSVNLCADLYGRDSREHIVPFIVLLEKRLSKYLDSAGCHSTVWRNILAATHLSTVWTVGWAQLSNMIRLESRDTNFLNLY
jgi:hypothetical protein